MIQYENFGPNGERRSELMTEERGTQVAGQTIMLGWPVVQRYVEDRDGQMISVVTFMTDTSGEVWRLLVNLH